MPNNTATDIATLITGQLSGGSNSARATFSAKTQAFAWTGPTLNSAISYISSGIALSRNFTVTRVENTTPISGAVTDGTQKPVTATLVPVQVALRTFPGVCVLRTSDVTDSANMSQAVGQALYGQCLQALDADLMAQLLADGTPMDDAPDLASIAAAQGALMGAGAFGDLIILDPVTYGALIGTAGSGILSGGNDPREAQLTLFAARLCVSSALTSPTAIVMDSTAAMSVELDVSPVTLVDVRARSNETDVVLEAIGASIVTRPDAIVVVRDITP